MFLLNKRINEIERGSKVEVGCSRLEVKLNGAGRPYFILVSSNGKTLLVSQSFVHHRELEDCLNSLKSAFSRSFDPQAPYPSYEVFRDNNGMLLIKLTTDQLQDFLFSGDYPNNQEILRIKLDIETALMGATLLDRTHPENKLP